jgi:tetratricopeptide (TPR) repeat protein
LVSNQGKHEPARFVRFLSRVQQPAKQWRQARRSESQVRPHQIALVCALFFNQSSPAWRAILKAHPSNPESYAHLGLLESRQQHYKQAIPLYRKALALDSSALSVHLDLGLALFKTG